MSVRQFVLDWDPKRLWFEWQFTGWVEMGGEQPGEFFWLPTDKHSKPAFSTKPLEELFHITKLTNKSKSITKERRMVIINSFYDIQSKEDSEIHFEIELEVVSILDSPNRVNVMIRCPLANKLIVEPCIHKDFTFGDDVYRYPTKYAEYTLTKPTRYSEDYI